MRKKTLISLMFALAFVVTISNKAGAVGSDLPSSDNPFWSVLDDPQMTSPDDSDCVSVATAFVPADQASIMCDGIAQIKTGMQAGMASDGINTNLFSQADWKHIDDLYFEKPGYGKIEFTEEINFMSYSFMMFMKTFGDRMEMQKGEIALDADVVNGLRNTGAKLTMYNAGNFNDLIILVNGDEDTEGVVSGLNYNAADGTITFNAAHFTSFKASERSSLSRPKISDVEAYIYTSKNSGKKYVKVEVEGKNFKKNSKITLGGKKSISRSYSSSKKIKATFSYNDLLKKGKKSLSVKVTNPNGKSRTYKDKIKLSELIEHK